MASPIHPGLMGELRAVEPTAAEQRDDRARAPQPDASGAATPVLLAMQRAAGNRAVSGLVRGGRRSVQRLDDNMAATLSSRADQQIAEARRGQDASRSGDGSDQAAPSEPPSAEQVAAEKTRQKAAIRGVVTPPDTSGAQSETAATAQAVQSEAAKPPESVAGSASGAPSAPPVPEAVGGSAGPGSAGGGSAGAGAGGGSAGGGGAQEAADRASAAAAEADAVPAPDVPAPVEVPSLPETLDGGGRAVPTDPTLQVATTGLTARIGLLRAAAHEIRTSAATERAQGHRIEGMLHGGLSAVADAADGVAELDVHSAHRRGVLAQGQAALAVSQQKAETVAAGAPEVRAKGDEGSAKSAPRPASPRTWPARTPRTPRRIPRPPASPGSRAPSSARPAPS